MTNDPIVIVGAARTPMGGFQGDFASLSASDLGAVAIKAAVERAGIEPGDRVLEINGRAMRYWEEIEDIVQGSPGKELQLRISRNGKEFERYVTPIRDTVRQRDGRFLADLTEEIVNLHDITLAMQSFGEDAPTHRRHLDRNLVRLELDERIARRDDVALFLHPPRHGGFDDRFTERRHFD